MSVALKNWSLEFPWISRSDTHGGPTLTAPDTRPSATPTHEDDIVRQVQAGDAAAFERIYEIHVRRIYALCLRMLADATLADELTQDIFVRAWEAVGSFKFQSAFGTWLHRLSVNVVLGYLRSEKNRLNRIIPVGDELDTYLGEVRHAMPETKIDVERAIAGLPQGAKEVLILHDIQGYRYREIAEMIGTAEGTIKSQLNRARRLVREALLR
ncbi:MAG: RNA polymerase sigma factor [Gemmatimonadales bacterium]